MEQWKIIGAFGLTEPEIGSGAAIGLTTTAKKVGDKWLFKRRNKRDQLTDRRQGHHRL
jgi:glutaryl-CoA dehydrogenase